MATSPTRRPIPISDRRHEELPLVRDTALAYVRDKIEDGRAGLDPFDAAIFVLDAADHEIVWAYRMLEQVGRVLVVAIRGDGRRYKALLEADVRVALELDTAHAAVMDDEPLASRAVEASAVLMDATIDALPMARVFREVH